MLTPQRFGAIDARFQEKMEMKVNVKSVMLAAVVAVAMTTGAASLQARLCPLR